MAKKETTATLERTYTVPLRKEFLKKPKYKRSKKAVSALREFIIRHLKTEAPKVKISGAVNQEIWKHGIKNPPHHIKVTATKNEKGEVLVELFGISKEKATAAEAKKKVKERIPKDIKKEKMPLTEEISAQPESAAVMEKA